MTEWYLMNPQPTLNSGFEKDEFADYAQDGFDELLTETQLGKKIIICNGRFDGENFETEVEIDGIVQSETPDAYTQGYKRQLLTRISDKIADYKYIKYDKKIWLIMTEPSDNCIYDKCVIHQCNYILKWQNAKREVIYCPASIENASQYNTGEEGKRILVLGYNQLMAYVSFDDDTVIIDRNLRVFIDYNTVSPIPYKVTRPDTVTYSYGEKRVICLILTEDQYNPKTDSIEDMLCDYYKISDTIDIFYSGNPTIRAGGTKTLKVNIPDIVDWSIESEIGATIIPNGNTARVKCPNNNSFVDNTITIKATVGNSVGECILTVTGGL